MTNEELKKLAEHLRDLAKKLNQYGEWRLWVQGNLQGLADGLDMRAGEEGE